MDELVWNEFNNDWESLSYESEILISKFTNQPLEKIAEIDINDLPIGKERETLIKARVNQNFFRSTVLSSYNSRCCITGLSIPELLVASHIIPWSVDKKNRLNPHNGLCLNSVHDRAFDCGLITITSNYKVKLSKYLYKFKKEVSVAELFLKYDNQSILLPDKFIPSMELLKYHNKNIFKDK